MSNRVKEIGDYVIEMKPGEVDSYCDFTVFEVDHHKDRTIFMIGYLRWDGCINFYFDNGGVMLHCCGRDDAKTFLVKIMDCIYDMAKELIVQHEGFD